MDQEIQTIKEQVDIVELVGEYVRLKRQGKDYFGPCPFHDEREPSFSVSPSKRMFFCFGCRKAGDIFDFWMEYHKVPFGQALAAICERGGLPVPQAGSREPLGGRIRRPKAPDRWEPKDYGMPSETWRGKAFKFVRWAYERLIEDGEAFGYLQARGIREETAAAFGLGWNPGRRGRGLFRTRESWGLSSEINEETGKAKALWLPIGWVIPVFRDGVVMKARIRRPDAHWKKWGPKYYFVPGGANGTMILPPAAGAPARGRIWVVIEAELDSILTHHEAGDMVGVIGLGSTGYPDQQAAGLLRNAAHILNALDFDAAGAEKREWWEKHFPEACRWPVPEGKDPGEAWQKGVDIRQWVIAGLPEGLRRVVS